MLTGRDIVLISSVEWDFLWQGHHEIASRLARAGNRVLYIENTGVRTPGLGDADRIGKRITSWLTARAANGVRQVGPSLYVCSPLVLPPFGQGWRRQINRRVLLPLIRSTAVSLGMRDPLIWNYLPTDTAFDIIQALRTDRSVVIYHCIADFAHLTSPGAKLRECERAIVEGSGLVFAQDAQLAAHCGQWCNEVHIFPFGVNLDLFSTEASRARTSHFDDAGAGGRRRQIVEWFRLLPRPVIGYIGGLHRHVDLGLLAEVARRRPGWSWIYVGLVQTPLGEFADLANVHLVGQRPHRELPDYVREFDVGIVPYVNSLYTNTVVPTKINEYLAMGKPVVSSRLPAVCEMEKEHGVVATAASEPDAFLAAIEAACALPPSPEAVRRRREVAALSDWSKRLEEMSALIEATDEH